LKKSLSFFSLILALIMTLALIGCGGGDKNAAKETPAKATSDNTPTVVLKYAHSFPVGHASYETIQFFGKRVEEISKGKVKIEVYPAEQLGKLKDLLNLCSQGIADIAYVPPSFYAGQVSLSTVMILPFYTTAKEGTEIFNRLVKDCPEISQEYLKYGVRFLYGNTTPQYDVGTVKKPVQTPEDLKGLKLKTSGGLFDKIAVRYGIQAVTVASPEVYEATQRGITEGNIFSYASIKGYRVNELQKFHTLGLRMGGYPLAYVINDKKWQSLSDDAKKALEQAGQETNKMHSERWDKDTEVLAAEFAKAGMTIYRIKPEDRAKWEAPLKGIENEWVQEMEKKGLPAKKVCDTFMKICKEVAK